MNVIQSISSFFKDFQSKAGSWVFWASVLGKLLTFTASLVAIRLVAKEELGHAIYAFTTVAFIIPFAGMGVFQSFLRYGSRLKSDEEKRGLFTYCLKYGLLSSLALVLVLIACADLLSNKLPESALFLRLFSLMLFSNLTLELIKARYRIFHNNKAYALADIAYSILLLALVFLGSLCWGATGYSLAFVLSPAIVGIFALWRFSSEKGSITLPALNFKSFWWYGVFSSLGNVTTELLFAIDIILIGNLLQNSELVTAYKYLTLIPFSLLFLSHVFMSTHYVSLTERIDDKAYIRKFIKNYILLFSLVCLAIVAGSFLLGDWLLELIDPLYAKTRYFDIFIYLIGGVCSILLLRGLFGNLLSAIGKAQANFFISLLALGLNLWLNYTLIPKHQLLGAAITSVSVMWFTSILSMGVFFYFFQGKDDG